MKCLVSLIAFLLRPTAPTGWVPAVARLVLGGVFILAGLGKFLNHDAYIARVDRWGSPEPGIGPAAAIAIDATVVRALLVPAFMRVMGDRNRWLPERVARIAGVCRPSARPPARSVARQGRRAPQAGRIGPWEPRKLGQSSCRGHQGERRRRCAARRSHGHDCWLSWR